MKYSYFDLWKPFLKGNAIFRHYLKKNNGVSLTTVAFTDMIIYFKTKESSNMLRGNLTVKRIK